jgi:hypothetical protein
MSFDVIVFLIKIQTCIALLYYIIFFSSSSLYPNHFDVSAYRLYYSRGVLYIAAPICRQAGAGLYTKFIKA